MGNMSIAGHKERGILDEDPEETCVAQGKTGNGICPILLSVDICVVSRIKDVPKAPVFYFNELRDTSRGILYRKLMRLSIPIAFRKNSRQTAEDSVTNSGKE